MVRLGRLGLMVGIGVLAAGLVEAQKPTNRVRTPYGTVRVRQRGAATVLWWEPLHGASRSLVLPKQEGIYPRSFWRLDFVGSPAPGVFVLETTYESRPGGPMLQCGAGQEVYVRVVDFRGKGRQALAELVESCWSDVESGDLRWEGESDTLLIEKADYRNDKTPHTKTVYRVGADGDLAVVSRIADAGQ